jgi:NADPH2:quinone reductase
VKSVVFHAFGGPEVLEIVEHPDPILSPGRLIVGVTAAAVHPTDILNVNGARADLMSHLTPPYTTGIDFAGTVAAIGDGVTEVAVGDRVIGVVAPRRAEGGSQAEMVVASERSIARVGASVDLVAAATVPMNALTAMSALELLALPRGGSLLITGAAGMLGYFATQLAVLDGFAVSVTASHDDRAMFDHVGIRDFIPRREGGANLRDVGFAGRFDGVIDAALIGQPLAHLVRDGGAIVSPRATSCIEEPRIRVHYVQVANSVEDADKIQRIARLLEEGALTPRVAATFTARRAQEAYALAARPGVRGRVVLTFSSAKEGADE